MVRRIECLLQVNEDRPSEKTVIIFSTDFIHKNGDSCFSGEIPAEARLTGRQKIVVVQITKQLTIDDFLSDFGNHW